MSEAGLYYLIEGILLGFFAVTGIQNVRHTANRLRRVVGFVLLFWLLENVVSVICTRFYLERNIEVSRLINCVQTLAEPASAFVLIELCRPGYLRLRSVLEHMVPFVALIAIYAFTFDARWYYAFLVFAMLYGIGVSTIVLSLLRRYEQFVKANYSDDDNISLRWEYWIVAAFASLLVVWLVCCLFDSVTVDILYLATSLLLWAAICYFVQKQESVAAEMHQYTPPDAATVSEEPSAPEETAEEAAADMGLAECIRTRFIEPRLFLTPKIKLGDMAQMIGTNRTYLSKYLNDTLGVTFYEYINVLRIEYALQLMERGEMSLHEISEAAGFTNYSTFHRVFTAKYGKPPSEGKPKTD